MRVPSFQHLRMLGGGRPPHAAWLADHYRHLCLATEHVTRLCRLINHLINGAERKISKPQIDNRSRPGQGSADGGPHDRGLRDWRGDDSFRPKFFFQTHVLSEDTATAQILTDYPDCRIGAH